jgi:chlorite dismutase
METQRGRVQNRLFGEVPPFRYVCFYPMNKRRGETLNWYSEGFERRALMMREHGHIGRHYAGKVTQIISGSIGYDDWEWGVDLYAPDPVTFKKLIYECGSTRRAPNSPSSARSTPACTSRRRSSARSSPARSPHCFRSTSLWTAFRRPGPR